MERGLLWLPLLIAFIWLAWQGWNEYQKVEAYRLWADNFDRAKYDIYAVLGQKDNRLTWGKPTRKGPVDLDTFSLQNIRQIILLIDNYPANLDELPSKGKTELEFKLLDRENSIKIPFTEIELAVKWLKYLQKEVDRAQ